MCMIWEGLICFIIFIFKIFWYIYLIERWKVLFFFLYLLGVNDLMINYV